MLSTTVQELDLGLRKYDPKGVSGEDNTDGTGGEYDVASFHRSPCPVLCCIPERGLSQTD